MINSLTSLRFFAIALIYLHHVGYPVGFGPAAVTFFFVLSGFVMALGTKEKFAKLESQDISLFYIRRLSKIYPLHILTFFLSIPTMYLAGFQTNLFYTLSNLLLIQTYFPSGIQVFGFNAVSWFIADIVLFYYFTPFLLHILRKLVLSNKVIYLLIAASLVFGVEIILGLLFNKNIPGYSFGWWLIYISPYVRLLDYFIGLLFGLFFTQIAKGENLQMRPQLSFTILEIWVLVMFGWAIYYHRFFLYDALGMGAYYVPFSLIVILPFAFQRGLVSTILSVKPLVYLGNLSFTIFLIHQILISWVGVFFASPIIGVPVNLNQGVAHLLLFVIILCISDVASRYFVEPCKIKIQGLLQSGISISVPPKSF